MENCYLSISDQGIPGLASTYPWFALRVRSNHEQTSSSVLTGRGFETFLPSVKLRRRWSDRVKLVDQPLFPGYIFCRFDPSNRTEVLRVPGVVHAVSMGSHLAPVDPIELHHIRTVVMAEMAAQPHPFLKIGQRVKVDHGPLAGVEGVLTATNGKSSLVLSISLLQRSLSVDVDASWVRAI